MKSRSGSTPTGATITFMVALALILTAALFVYVTASDEQPREASIRTVDLRPGASFADAKTSYDWYERAVRREPDVARHHAGLAQSILQRARETGREFSLIPRAEAAVDRALELAPGDIHALVLRATILNKLHRFEDALSVTDRVLASVQDQPAALAARIDALVEMGRLEEAVVVSDRLLSVKPGLAAYSRAAYLRELHADTDGARSAMQMAARAGVAGSVDRAWALVKLAEMSVAEGDTDRARRILEGTLEERFRYPPALTALAHAALVENDLERAEFLADQVRSLTDGAAPLGILLEIHRLRGDDRRANEIVGRIERAFQRAREMGENVRMEYADFLLDEGRDVHRALDWSAAEYERRPQHLHAGETYAWALHQVGRTDEAVRLMGDVLARSPEDPMLQFRAARIHRAAGNEDAAVRLARSAVEGGLRFESPLTDREARRFLNRVGSPEAEPREVGSVAPHTAAQPPTT